MSDTDRQSREDDVLRRMLATPPEKHKPLKRPKPRVGKSGHKGG